MVESYIRDLIIVLVATPPHVQQHPSNYPDKYQGAPNRCLAQTVTDTRSELTLPLPDPTGQHQTNSGEGYSIIYLDRSSR